MPLLPLLLLGVVAASTSTLQEDLISSGLAQDLAIKAPEAMMKVAYPEREVEAGDTLEVEEAREEPGVVVEAAEDGELYTLGESLRAGGEVGGKEVVRYAGPSPPLGSGPHRYALLVWRQEGRVQVPAPRGRGRFGLTQLTTNYDLGHPVAANFFYAENT